MPGEDVRAFEIDFERLVPGALVGIDDGAEIRIGPRVVDEDVHAAELRLGLRDQPLDVFLLADVGRHAVHFFLDRPQLAQRRLDRVLFAAADGDGRPRFGKSTRDGEADAPRRPGHDGVLAGKIKTVVHGV